MFEQAPVGFASLSRVDYESLPVDNNSNENDCYVSCCGELSRSSSKASEGSFFDQCQVGPLYASCEEDFQVYREQDCRSSDDEVIQAHCATESMSTPCAGQIIGSLG